MTTPVSVSCIFAAILLSSAASLLFAADYEWVNVTMNAEFAPRDGAGELSYRGAMWLIDGSAVLQGRTWMLGGGTYDTPQTPCRNFYNDVWSSADGVNWTLHAEAAPWAG